MSRCLAGLVVVLAVTLAAPTQAEPRIRAGVDVAVPVDVTLEDGAVVVTEASGGAAFDAFMLRLRAPLVLRVDRPRLDLGNLLLQATFGSDDSAELSVIGVVPTLWPAATERETQAASLGLAATGLGFADAARFVPAATGLGVDTLFEFFDGDPRVVVRGGAGMLVSLAGAPLQVPAFAGVRVIPTEEVDLYLGASLGALMTPEDFLAQSSLTLLGEVGVVLKLDELAIDVGVGAGFASTPEESVAGVVTPRLIVVYGD